VILRDEFCNKGLRKIRDSGWPYTSALRLTFHTSEKGINTISNFKCFTGKIPIRSRQEEGRVRKILNLAYAEFDKATEKISYKKMPSIDEGTVPAWNQERNTIAMMVQEKVN
jgi:hypothetical protein